MSGISERLIFLPGKDCEAGLSVLLMTFKKLSFVSNILSELTQSLTPLHTGKQVFFFSETPKKIEIP